MNGLAYVAAAASIAFYAFIAWAVLAHVKEQRSQSAILAKMASLLERSLKDD